MLPSPIGTKIMRKPILRWRETNATIEFDNEKSGKFDVKCDDTRRLD